MKREGKKFRGRRALAGVMASLMVVSVIDVSGWNIDVAKAAESSADTAVDAHNYDEDGFCIDKNCDAYEPAVLTTDKYDLNGDDAKDEVYEIGNAGQLYWFAALVNGDKGLTSDMYANAVLTDDIVVNENVIVNGELAEDTSDFRKWVSISDYYGIFDGDNHKISGVYVSQSIISGFVARTCSGAEVRNLTIEDSFIFSNNRGAAFVVYNKSAIINCHTVNTIIHGDISAGGICGYNEGSIINCSNDAAVSGRYVGGIAGYCGVGNNIIIQNNYNVGVIKNKHGNKCAGGIVGLAEGDSGKFVLANNYNLGEVVDENGVLINKGLYGSFDVNNVTKIVKDCFYLSDNDETDNEETESDGISGKTAEQFASGEVACLLQEADHVWGQTLGRDKYPVINGATVYKNNKYKGHVESEDDCEGVVYTNTNKSEFTHTLQKTERVEASCLTDGAEEYWTCSECGKKFCDEGGKNEINEPVTINALGHDYRIDSANSTDETDNSINLVCTRDGCTEQTAGHTNKVTITAPDDSKLGYNGTSKEASVAEKIGGMLDKLPTVKYAGDNLVDGKAVYPGTYTAFITMRKMNKRVIKSVEFEITKGKPVIKTTPTASAITEGDTLAQSTLSGGEAVFYINSAGENGSQIETAVAGNFEWKDSTIKPTVADSGKTKYKVIFHPTDTVNCNDVETEITLTVNVKPDSGSTTPDQEPVPTPQPGTDAGSGASDNQTPSSQPSTDAGTSDSQTPSTDTGTSGNQTPSSQPSADAGSGNQTPSADAGTSDNQTPSTDAGTSNSKRPAKKGTKFTSAKYKGLQFTVTGSSAKNPTVSCKALKNAKGNITIPATVSQKGITYKVTAIQAKAFRNNKKITSIVIGRNVSKIGKQAFYGCTKLKKIDIRSEVLTTKTIQNGAFSGVSAKTTITVPKKKLKAYKQLLVKKGLNKKVKVRAK